VRVLHLISNYKFTGPVDPALLLAQSLNEREDFEVLAGLGKPPAGEEDRFARAVARARSIPLSEALDPKKHRRFLTDWIEVGRLKRVLREFGPAVVHTHLGNDLRLALKASSPCVVHSFYASEAEDIPRSILKTALKRAAGVVVHTQRLREELSRSDKPVLYVPPPLDLERFDPRRKLSTTAASVLPPHGTAVGVVARMQRHRLFDLLLRAFKRAADAYPGLLLVVVGRGTRAREVAVEPVRRLGLEGRVHFTGYVSGDDYVALLKKFAFLVFLVPGSDGTCRALREAMAMGKPVVGSRRGAIPELIGEGGATVEESEKSLTGALLALARDGEKRERMGRRAARRARSFDRREVAARIAGFYRSLEVASPSGRGWGNRR